MTPAPILPAHWNPKDEGDRVLARLVNVCLPTVKGAHDSDFLIHQGKAYVVYMGNDVQPGESPYWPFVYCAFSVVDVATFRVEATETFAASEMAYENETLLPGACFVPRILQKDDRTLRCFFASEAPGARQSQTWFIDYDLGRRRFERRIHRAQLQTTQGLVPMQPQHYQRHVAAEGFTGKVRDYGLYMINGVKRFDDRLHAVLNTFPGGPSSLAVLTDALDGFRVLGTFMLPQNVTLSEAAAQRMPDGSWCAISRQEGGTSNYMFARSADGVHWSAHEMWPLVPNGANSKPTFDRFGDVYYLGWQEATRIGGVARSVFNIEVSRDGRTWERKYRFETERSFQYPVFRQHGQSVLLSVTQGDTSDSRKERIMFGLLE